MSFVIGIRGISSDSFSYFLFYFRAYARLVGNPLFGGDIGFELSFAFTAVVYPIARYVERRYENPQRMRRRDGRPETGGMEVEVGVEERKSA